MTEKIIKFPHVNSEQRFINEHGQYCIQCKVSDRWLSFSPETDASHTLLLVDVMTTNMDKNDKKICSLCLDINELKKLISLYQ